MARKLGSSDEGRRSESRLGSPAAAAEMPLPPGAEELREILKRDVTAAAFWDSVQARRAPHRLASVRGAAECGDPRASKLLAAALWDEDAAVALTAVNGLRAAGSARAIPSLEWLGKISRVERVSAAAREAAAALREHGEPSPAPAGEAECWASFIDGDGAQLLMAIRPAGGERQRLATAAFSDRRGIVDASGTDSAASGEVTMLRGAGDRRSGGAPPRIEPGAPGRSETVAGGTAGNGEESPEIGWVRVDGAYCAAAVEAARQIHRRDHRRLPGAWEFWRDDFLSPAVPAVLALDDRALPAVMLQRRLHQTAPLIHFEGFRSWLILGEDLAPFLPAALEALKRRGTAREEGLSAAISSCLACVVQKPQRRLWRARLLRQAALWERSGDRIVRELCLAAAWGLDDRNSVPSEEHPLLRAMTRASLEAAIGF